MNNGKNIIGEKSNQLKSKGEQTKMREIRVTDVLKGQVPEGRSQTTVISRL